MRLNLLIRIFPRAKPSPHVRTTLVVDRNLPGPATAVPELLYSGAWTPSGVFLEKTPSFTDLRGAREFWNRSETLKGELFP